VAYPGKKLASSHQKYLLWVDLEMTGLDATKDRILEVAAIVTDWDFNEVDTFTAVQKVNEALVKSRMVGEFWDNFSDVRSALIEQNETGVSARKVENQLIDLLDKYFDKNLPVILAGNSIHKDREFIAHEWPRFNARLNYRMLDVSAWKVVFENKLKRGFPKPEAHRALDDIRGSILELKHYLRYLR